MEVIVVDKRTGNEEKAEFVTADLFMTTKNNRKYSISSMISAFENTLTNMKEGIMSEFKNGYCRLFIPNRHIWIKKYLEEYLKASHTNLLTRYKYHNEYLLLEKYFHDTISNVAKPYNHSIAKLIADEKKLV